MALLTLWYVPQSHPSCCGNRSGERSAQMSRNKVSRRYFLSASIAAGGGLLIGYSLSPAVVAVSDVAFASPQDKPLPNNEIPLNAWIRITPNDEVTLISSQSEMGQGVMTTLPAILAE